MVEERIYIQRHPGAHILAAMFVSLLIVLLAMWLMGIMTVEHPGGHHDRFFESRARLAGGGREDRRGPGAGRKRIASEVRAAADRRADDDERKLARHCDAACGQCAVKKFSLAKAAFARLKSS